MSPPVARPKEELTHRNHVICREYYLFLTTGSTVRGLLIEDVVETGGGENSAAANKSRPVEGALGCEFEGRTSQSEAEAISLENTRSRSQLVHRARKERQTLGPMQHGRTFGKSRPNSIFNGSPNIDILGSKMDCTS